MLTLNIVNWLLPRLSESNVTKLLQSKFCKQSFTELWVDKQPRILIFNLLKQNTKQKGKQIMNKNNMNDTTKIASAINDLQNVKIPVKIDGENKFITKITPVPGHDGMFYFEVAVEDSILSRIVMPFDDEYDVCVKAVNDFLDKNNSKQTTKKENTNMTTKLNDEMMKELNREIRAFNKTITSSTTNKEIWNKKLELSKKYGLKIVGIYCDEKKFKFLKIATLKKNDESICICISKNTDVKKTEKKTEKKNVATKKVATKKTEVKNSVVKKIRKNKYFYEYVPSFTMNKKDIKNVLSVIAKGTTNYSLKLNHDFVINGFNYLTENQKNEVAAASIKYSNSYKRKHIEMKKNLLFAINDAKLILKYL